MHLLTYGLAYGIEVLWLSPKSIDSSVGKNLAEFISLA